MFLFNYVEERMKVAWPVSDREALLHYFEIEYFKEDLVIILLNTVRLRMFWLFDELPVEFFSFGKSNYY